MSVKERIFHSLLFEVIALFLLAGLAYLITQQDPLKMTGLAVTISLIAMAWNYLFNLGFDRVYGSDRLSRTLMMRIGHGIAFEIGMLVFSFPVIMWVLQLDFWTVLVLDFGAVLFFLVYAVIFNWVYDIVRARYFSPTYSSLSEAK